MVKGVNKSIIEIKETGNKYFTKAIFFVSPEFSKSNESRLEREAKLTFSNLCDNNPENTNSLRLLVRKDKNRKALIISAVTVGVITAAILILLNIIR